MKEYVLKFCLTILTALFVALSGTTNLAAGNFSTSTIRFYETKELITKMLPNSYRLSQIKTTLNRNQISQLNKWKNWNSDINQFVFYLSKNRERKIVRTLVLFPEQTRQGLIMVATTIDNNGIVDQAEVFEASQATINWLLPLLRSGFMKHFKGKSEAMSLKLPKYLKSSRVSRLSLGYGVHLNNAVKKSSQLFNVVFKNNRPSNN